ncbi:hypothetical protein FLK61_31490 [Paenalkalicoccus suaedae]|uniref:Uncharacterized protein n=1 Tax=Paenalkalicoccus suaedae TaxID=2592382 RepID=A0A859FG83_9BACI|nr:hypothetical protein [Paenalkalicoccus suaedae]QKS71236.1 hypothetical protein FLK61_31490 [Paenalkalicoccus suaedae]
MAVTFYLANSISEALTSDSYLDLEDNVHLYLYNNRGFVTSRAELLIGLDPYGYKIFSSDEISDLILLCKLCRNQLENKEVYLFLEDLIGFSKKAVDENKLLVAIGD